MTTKPDDISQEAWDAAGSIKPLPAFKFAEWAQVLHADIARAIMAAKAEEREACAAVANNELARQSGSDAWANGYRSACAEIADRIRKRGEA